MTVRLFQFGDFTLDAVDRRLLRSGAVVELNNRYFDALTLLLGAPGQLVSKDRFMDAVWHGVPVTDEALTQCIRTLRRQLNDDAARPRFIETVPKHGYRFIAPVRLMDADDTPTPGERIATRRWHGLAAMAAAGMAGGGSAGIAGGLLYGFSIGPDPAGMGATSILFVLLAINMLVGLVGGLGVALGLAIADRASGDRQQWWVGILGGSIGGLMTGATAKLVGLDAFRLLLGEAPAKMTGATEGALLGAAAGLAAWLARRGPPGLTRAMALGGLTCGIAGLAIAATGGQLLGGSLDMLLHRFPGAHVRLDTIGALLGEQGFGPISRAVTSGIEGALFGSCLIGAIHVARTVFSSEETPPFP